VIAEALATERVLAEAMGLDHRPHRAIQDQDAVLEQGAKLAGTVGTHADA
jgi:hypothetical protein